MTTEPTPTESSPQENAASETQAAPTQETASPQQSADQSGIFEQNNGSGDEKLYAGKYKSVEELEKAYGEAQKLIGKKAPKTEESGGFDLASIGKKFQEQRSTGEFDADVIEALNHFGIQPGYVSQAEQAIRSQNRSSAEEALGRSVDWDAWNTWQAENLTQAQKDAAVSLIAEGDYSLLDRFVQSFESREAEAAGESEPAKPKGKIGTAPSGSKAGASGPSDRTPFRSRKELSEAMAEAGSDYSKWQKIEARLAVTDPAIANG